MRRLAAAAVLAVALGGCAHAGARPAAGTSLAADLGEQGEVTFQVPDGWKATSGEDEASRPRSIRFEPPAERLVLGITPFPGSDAAGDRLDLDAVRKLVESARDQALAQAAEQELAVVPLPPPGLRGWYFVATDRELAGGQAPGPDEYRCMVQGVAVAGPVLLAFTLLDDGDGPARRTALALVRGASHRPARAALSETAGAPPRPATGGRDADASRWSVRDAEPVELELPGRPWSLLLDLPGWRVANQRRREDGRGVSVIGQRPSDGLILSASLAEAGGGRDAEGCREEDWSRIAGLGGVGGARRETGGGEARVWYDVGGAGQATRHLSAWRYRDGACLHLHLSLPGSEPGVDARLLKGLDAARYAEAL